MPRLCEFPGLKSLAGDGVPKHFLSCIVFANYGKKWEENRTLVRLIDRNPKTGGHSNE